MSKPPPDMPPQDYPAYPRALPPIPEDLATPDILATANFVNERLDRFHQVEERKAEVEARGQEWGDKSSKKLEKAMWVEMCPLTILGTKYIQRVIAAKERTILQQERLAAFKEETKELSDFHKILRENRFTYETLLPYSKVELLDGPEYHDGTAFKHTELKAAIHASKWEKLRKGDRRKRPAKYLMYAIEAEKEWKMIKRFKDLLDGQGEEDCSSTFCKNHFIEDRMDFLKRVKQEIQAQVDGDEEEDEE